MEAMLKNDTWEFTTLPKRHKAIGVRQRTKQWSCTKPDLLQRAISNDKEFLIPKSLHARIDTIRLLIALAAQNRYQIYQIDVKSAFLSGYNEEEVYIEQPIGYVNQRHRTQGSMTTWRRMAELSVHTSMPCTRRWTKMETYWSFAYTWTTWSEQVTIRAFWFLLMLING